MGVGKITKRIVREVIENIVVTRQRGSKTYPFKDKEEYIVATLEKYGSYRVPRYKKAFTYKTQQVLHDVVGQIIDNGIKPASSKR